MNRTALILPVLVIAVAAALSSVAQGVQIVRVHDVAETRQAIAVWQAAMLGSETAVTA